MSAKPEDVQAAADKTVPDPEKWVAPEFVTYGKAFDPQKIPKRRWLLGRRRAVGEVTVDAGPPGVNKSMLLLTDAVAIVAGRKLLADELHETGGVLLLAGEDSRRDVEARLAGILAYYSIKPAELRNRLHVVYLDESEDPSSYSLAHMRDDMAMLNTRMTDWLREFPDVIAIMVDPLAAWHQTIENTNEAAQVLWGALRGIAVRSHRHVGVDHHVTKASMLDPEAHVGNLAALRGGGALGAGVRWAFTMARLKPETAERHGIKPDEAAYYRRLDSLKASYGPDANCERLLRVESVAIGNGESTGVLAEMNLARVYAEAQERKVKAALDFQAQFGEALANMLEESHPMSANGAATWLASRYARLFRNQKNGGEGVSETTLRRRLPVLIGKGLQTNRGVVEIHGVGSGKGHGAVIDFRHHFEGSQRP
jgi:hypothetical protein